MSDARSELLTKNPWSLMIKLSIPAILGQFVVGLYAFVDSIYVGQMISTDAMSAVSVASPFILINSAIAVLVGVGSGSVLSRAIGKKDQQTVDKIMGNLALLVLILSSISMIIGILFAPTFLKVSGAEGNVLDMGVSYLRTVFIGSIFVNFMCSANMILRAEGRMSTAMGIMASGAILNIILDPVFIILMPDYGPQAVGVATVVSQFVQAAFTLWYFLRKSPVIKFHGLKLAEDIIPEIFSVGVSAMLMQVMMIALMIVTYKSSVKYGGADQIALMGATQRISQLSFVPVWGMSQALQPVVGTNFGAKKYSRVKSVMTAFIVGSTCLSLGFCLLAELLPSHMLSAFITDSSIVESGISNFRIAFSTFFASGFFIMGVTYFQAIGKAKQAGILVMLRQFIMPIPLLIILPILMNSNVTGVWLATPIGDIIVFLICLFLIKKDFKTLKTM